MGFTSIGAKYLVIHSMIAWYFASYTSIIILIILPLSFNTDSQKEDFNRLIPVF